MLDLRTAADAHTVREQAQRASPISWGSSGRRFKSCQPDKEKPALTCVGAGFLLFGCGWFWWVECPSGPRVSQGIQLVGLAAEPSTSTHRPTPRRRTPAEPPASATATQTAAQAAGPPAHPAPHTNPHPTRRAGHTNRYSTGAPTYPPATAAASCRSATTSQRQTHHAAPGECVDDGFDVHRLRVGRGSCPPLG
jgi:hypothetical protein